MENMKITLVRHGQTEGNYLGNIQGRNNELLNDTGRRQCQRLRDKIKEILLNPISLVLFTGTNER